MAHPVPHEGVIRAAWRAGPGSVALANRFLDAMIAGVPSQPVPQTPSDRFGWRFWALRPDGALVSPYAGAQATSGTLEARCPCGRPAAPGCTCGIHYVLDVGDLIAYARKTIRHLASKFEPIARLCDNSWALALTYGVAIGNVENDRTAYAVMSSRRAPRWRMLALLCVGLSPERAGELGARYGCEVIGDVSIEACQAVEQRLRSSLSGAEIAELASRPAAALA